MSSGVPWPPKKKNIPPLTHRVRGCSPFNPAFIFLCSPFVDLCLLLKYKKKKKENTHKMSPSVVGIYSNCLPPKIVAIPSAVYHSPHIIIKIKRSWPKFTIRTFLMNYLGIYGGSSLRQPLGNGLNGISGKNDCCLLFAILYKMLSLKKISFI